MISFEQDNSSLFDTNLEGKLSHKSPYDMNSKIRNITERSMFRTCSL